MRGQDLLQERDQRLRLVSALLFTRPAFRFVGMGMGKCVAGACLHGAADDLLPIQRDTEGLLVQRNHRVADRLIHEAIEIMLMVMLDLGHVTGGRVGRPARAWVEISEGDDMVPGLDAVEDGKETVLAARYQGDDLESFGHAVEKNAAAAAVRNTAGLLFFLFFSFFLFPGCSTDVFRYTTRSTDVQTQCRGSGEG